jgi:hypothetical protein
LTLILNGENMKQQNKELTAYCGLFCGDCIRYKSKASDLALQLLNELRKTKFGNYVKVKQMSVKELESYEEVISALEAIQKLKCNIPCRLGGDGCVQLCEIAKCVHLNEIEGCWECKEFEACNNFEFLRPFHGNTPQNNLKKIKKCGLDKWAVHRESIYTWSERTSED